MIKHEIVAVSVAANTAGLANDVAPASGVALTLAANNAADSLAHLIVITNNSATDYSTGGKTLAVVGTGPNGEAQTETITGPGASTTTTTTKHFLSAASVTPNYTRGAADTVDVASLFETNPGDLRLIDTDSDGAVRAVRFYVNEGKIYISENGEAGVALSPDSVTISSLIFYNLSNLNSQAVRIKLEVEKNQNNRITTLPFSDTVILRGSYQ